MSQQTLVYQVDAATAERLRQELQAHLPPDAAWRRQPHARFAVASMGVVVACYLSGKLVVQGRDAEAFAARFLGGIARAPSGGMAAPSHRGALIGSDETGKGDYFGPLVVAAAFVGEGDAKALTELGVTDSKNLSDERMRRIVGALERQLDHEIVVLPPAEYNARYASTPNVNVLLAELHARALAPLIGRHPGVPVLVDRFAADDALLQNAVARRAPDAPTIAQRPRAESELAVGAASILARIAFLEGLAACAQECGSDLPKGAGAPVDAAARRVHRIGGLDLLGKVAKVHFRNTRKIPGL